MGSTLFYDVAAVHKYYPVGNLSRKAHFMGYDHHGHSVGSEILHDLKYFTDHFGIKR